jgi:hypothetical protein
MDCQQAVDQLRSKLEASFGKAMTMMIVASASNAVGASTMSLTPEQFVQLADAVCRDQRVVGMWGAAGAADVAAQWRQLVA